MLSLRTWDTPTAEPAVNRQGVGGSDLKLLLSGEDLSGLHLWAPGDTVGHLSVWVELSAPPKGWLLHPRLPKQPGSPCGESSPLLSFPRCPGVAAHVKYLRFCCIRFESSAVIAVTGAK